MHHLFLLAVGRPSTRRCPRASSRWWGCRKMMFVWGTSPIRCEPSSPSCWSSPTSSASSWSSSHHHHHVIIISSSHHVIIIIIIIITIIIIIIINISIVMIIIIIIIIVIIMSWTIQQTHSQEALREGTVHLLTGHASLRAYSLYASLTSRYYIWWLLYVLLFNVIIAVHSISK